MIYLTPEGPKVVKVTRGGFNRFPILTQNLSTFHFLRGTLSSNNVHLPLTVFITALSVSPVVS